MAGILKVDRVQSDSNLAFQIGSSNVAYFNNTGLNVTGGEIIAGGSTLRTSSGLIYANNGIKFPATQSSSSDANTLDDYEEGTFTMSVTGIGSAVSRNSTGYYTKIGNTVAIFIDYGDGITTGAGSGSSDIQMTLPFVCTGNFSAPVGIQSVGPTLSDNKMNIYIPKDNSYCLFYTDSATSWDRRQGSEITADWYFGATFVYRTN